MKYCAYHRFRIKYHKDLTMAENEQEEIMDEFETFDFIINEEDEVMLLLYEQDSEPQNPRIEIDLNEKSAVLIRNENGEIFLDGISDEVIDSLQDEDKLMVCELSKEENEDDTKIVYAYEADIVA